MTVNSQKINSGKINRRQFLSGLASSGIISTGFLPLASISNASAKSSENNPAYIATRRDANGHYSAAVINCDGALLFSEMLEDRGHATAISPDKRLAVVFARRPGRFALVLDLEQQNRRLAFMPPEDHHFYGHGFFSADGRLLYATENDYENERGIIGVYDVADNFKRVSQLDTQGIGPHEAILLSDGRTIAVANGGIVTHPDYPRQKLNLSTMEPSISYLDARDGKLLSQSSLPKEYYQLSLRHMAEAKGGTLWIGGQYEGSPSDSINLVASHTLGNSNNEIRLLAEAKTYQGMKHYIGSVAVNLEGNLVATTAPKGNKVAIWESESKQLLKIINREDAGGVAPDVTRNSPHNKQGFVISDGFGNLWQGNQALHQNPEIAWDNHISSL